MKIIFVAGTPVAVLAIIGWILTFTVAPGAAVMAAGCSIGFIVLCWVVFATWLVDRNKR